MKLPTFEDFAPFVSLRQRMGATNLGTFEVYFPRVMLSASEKAELDERGIEIEDIGEVRVLDDGTLAYKNSRVLVHIRDVHKYQRFSPIPRELPRFHVANCRTLQEMRLKNRFGRYVVATRDDGKFVINIQSRYRTWEELLSELWVCKNCLDHLQFDGYSHQLGRTRKEMLFNRFSLGVFFEKYPKSPIATSPAHSDISSPLDDYPNNWREISDNYRQKVGWSCEECTVSLAVPKYRKFLHVHHVNGIRSDCDDTNLQALCVRCHSDLPDHAHMRNTPDVRAFDALVRLGRIKL